MTIQQLFEDKARLTQMIKTLSADIDRHQAELDKIDQVLGTGIDPRQDALDEVKYHQDQDDLIVG